MDKDYETQKQEMDFENSSNDENQEAADVDQNMQKCEEEDKQVFCDQKETVVEETEDVSQEKEDSFTEEKKLEEDVLVTEQAEENESKPQQFSYTYEPPYGVPVSVPSEKPRKEKRSSEKQSKALLAFVIAIAVVLAFIGGAVAGQLFFDGNTSLPLPSGGGENNVLKQSFGFSEVVEKVASCVVEIEGSGSGVIVTENGYILTNQHVVENLDNIFVVLTNGSRYAATYIGGDEKYDVAMVKIEPKEDLLTAMIGKSADLKVGDEVLAIGNPLATLGGTVTNGIISAKDRQIRVEHYLMTLLQTDAAVNPGNSGGGLFNMSGELIGVVNAKQFATGIEGLGFAIPIDIAWKAAQDIMEYGYVKNRPDIGISMSNTAPGPWYPDGVYITSSTNSLLKVNDRILTINGNPVNRMDNIYPVTDKMKIGDVIEITVSRWNGTQFEAIPLSVTVVEYAPQT